MKFSVEKNKNPNLENYSEDVYRIAYDFSQKVYKEFGSFLRSIVLFGGVAREKHNKKGDIDILVVVDDIHVPLNAEGVEA
mgnify:FL=1